MENKYLVFTRKWPAADIWENNGQDQVTVPLKRAIRGEQDKARVTFFPGPGHGRQRLARVFAKALNCEKGRRRPLQFLLVVQGDKGRQRLDVIEIDGASNNGVEEIRKLREYVGFGTAGFALQNIYYRRSATC